MTIEEYFRTTGDGPDPDFVDGEIVERNVGEDPHSDVQAKLIGLFLELAKTQPVHVRPELTMRVAPKRIRVADVAVFTERPTERIPSKPPLVVLEILSTDDRHAEIIRKFEDYRNWGVPHIWLVDPFFGKLHVYGNSGLAEASALEIPEFDFGISKDRLFA